MSQCSWKEERINEFFSSRTSPTRAECDRIAQSVTGATTVASVDGPGSSSYTVVCYGCTGFQPDLVVSFREQGKKLEKGIVKLAKGIHSDLVPESAYHGDVEGADPPLAIYSMPYLAGKVCLEVLPFEIELSPEEEVKVKNYIRGMARYFALCWLNKQTVEPRSEQEQQDGIHRRLSRLAEELPSAAPLRPTVNELINVLPSLFSQETPRVLTHDAFTVTDILQDENDFHVTGIVDWSRAKIRPFGFDMDILLHTTGINELKRGWDDYSCKPLLYDTFWEEFWAATGIEEEETKKKTRSLAEAAGKVSAIIKLLFRWENGVSTEEVVLAESKIKLLEGCFGVQAKRN